MSTPAEPPVVVVEQPVSVDEPPRRHALGLPAGSVRALLALGILGLLWAIALRYEYGGPALAYQPLPLAFIYLQIVMVLVLAHFFAAHGSTIGPRVSRRSPLGVPRGSVRFLLLVGYLGLAGYLFYTRPEVAEIPDKGQPLLLLLVLLLSGFFVGNLLTGFVRLIGRGRAPDWFLDFQAWVALLALFGMAGLVIVHLFINPSVGNDYKIDIPTFEAGLAGLIAFYFGARS